MIVVIQMILGHAGNENIGPAIVIEIADCDSHIVPIARQAGLFRDVCEGLIMVVVVEAVVVFRRVFRQRWNCSAVEEEDVQISIVVVIEQGDARNHRFGLILVWSWTAVLEKIHTGFCCDVFETDGAGMVGLRCNYVCRCQSDCYRQSKDAPAHGSTGV